MIQGQHNGLVEAIATWLCADFFDDGSRQRPRLLRWLRCFALVVDVFSWLIGIGLVVLETVDVETIGTRLPKPGANGVGSAIAPIATAEFRHFGTTYMDLHVRHFPSSFFMLHVVFREDSTHRAMALTKQQRLARRAKLLGLNATGTEKELQRRIDAHYKQSPKRRRRKTTPRKRGRRRKVSPKKRKGRKQTPKKPQRKLSYGPHAPGPWKGMRPNTMQERDEILSYCGPQCFADARLTFPICPKCDATQCYCQPDCGALKAAYDRGHDQDTMLRYGRMLNCGWVPPVYDVGGLPALAPAPKLPLMAPAAREPTKKQRLMEVADRIKKLSDVHIFSKHMVALFSRTKDVWVIETITKDGKREISTEPLTDGDVALYIRSIPYKDLTKLETIDLKGKRLVLFKDVGKHGAPKVPKLKPASRAASRKKTTTPQRRKSPKKGVSSFKKGDKLLVEDKSYYGHGGFRFAIVTKVTDSGKVNVTYVARRIKKIGGPDFLGPDDAPGPLNGDAYSVQPIWSQLSPNKTIGSEVFDLKSKKYKQSGTKIKHFDPTRKEYLYRSVFYIDENRPNY